MDDVLLRIGEIAAFFNVSVKAMRIYEKMGILKPVKVDDQTGYRYYNADQVKQLDAIIELRRLGFSLAEIKSVLENGMTKETYMQMLVCKRAFWQDQAALANDKIGNINGIIERLATSEPPTKLHELTEQQRANLLSRMVCVEDLHARNVISEAIWL